MGGRRAAEGGTGFQPVTCGSHSQDGCATLRTQGRCKPGSLTAQARAVMASCLFPPLSHEGAVKAGMGWV
jgi:hypothetical protein